MVRNAAIFPRFNDPLDIGRSGRQLDLIRMRIEHGLHRVAQIERASHGFSARIIHRNPQREERRMHPAFLKPWNIGMTDHRALAEIRSGDEHFLDGIGVAVDTDNFGREFPGVRHLVLGHQW